MVVVTAAVFLTFWLRDYMSLRMSPRTCATRRALLYGAAVLLTAAIIWAWETRIGFTKLARLIESPSFLFGLIAFHLAASALSLWINKTENYRWMWVTALLPAPVVWFLLLETTVVSGRWVGGVGQQSILLAVALMWAASMVIVIFSTRYVQMPASDLDFAMQFGSMTHCLAACVLPLAFSAG